MGVAENNGLMKLYVNGLQEGTASLGTLWTGGDRWDVGTVTGSGSIGYFDGTIDDVRLYNRALSAAEVQQLYNAGR